MSDTLADLVWLAYSGSKTDRFDAFHKMLELDPTEDIIELCHRGLASWTPQKRSVVIEDLMQALGEKMPLDSLD